MRSASDVTVDARVKLLYRCSELNTPLELTLQFLSQTEVIPTKCAAAACQLPAGVRMNLTLSKNKQAHPRIRRLKLFLLKIHRRSNDSFDTDRIRQITAEAHSLGILIIFSQRKTNPEIKQKKTHIHTSAYFLSCHF